MVCTICDQSGNAPIASLNVCVEHPAHQLSGERCGDDRRRDSAARAPRLRGCTSRWSIWPDAFCVGCPVYLVAGSRSWMEQPSRHVETAKACAFSGRGVLFAALRCPLAPAPRDKVLASRDLQAFALPSMPKLGNAGLGFID